jgi:type IV pilus biogenesis protein PilP
MKKLEKEQLPKVIAIGIIAAALLGYAGFTWLGHGGSEAAPAAAATPHSAAVAHAAPAAPSAVDKVLALPPINHDNPFQPALTVNNGPAPQAPPAAAKPAVPKPKGAQQIASLPDNLNGPAMDGVPGLPPMLSGPAPAPAPQPAAAPASGAPSRPVPHAAPAPPKPPSVLVTGILEGDENVAILKWSDAQRQVVRVGDHLDGGYVVKAIRSDAVVLAQRGSEWVMRLGTAPKAG